MNEFVTFITNNWIAVAIFIVLILAFIANEARENLDSSQISPHQTVSLINHQDALVLDLRSEKAFSDSHIVGALHLPYSLLESKLTTLKKYAEKPIILLADQNEAKKAYNLLQKQNFRPFILKGGLASWRMAGLPLSKKG